MTIRNILILVGFLIAIVLYIPLIKGIMQGQIKQSFATWALWVSLDLIACVSIALQKGNYWILVCYVIGGTIVAYLLIHKGQFKWTWFETLTLFLVLFCLILWYTSGSRMATISSTIAVLIAGFPQIKDSWEKPDRIAGFLYFGYVIVNILFFLGGKNWTIEDRFYPGCMIPLCLLIAIVSLRQKKNTTDKILFTSPISKV